MNLPNKLTVVRLIIIPFFLLLMVLPLSWGSVTFWGATIPVAQLIAAILFIAATITDNLDGRIARKDHLIVLTGSQVVPAWVTAIIIWRELSVTGLRLLLVEQDGVVLAAKMPGKIKTTTQFIAIIFLLLNNVIFAIWNIPFGQIMLYICLFFTIYSGVDYFIQGRGVFSDGFK